MSKVLFESVRSDGCKFNFNNGTWGIIPPIEGLDFPEIDLYTKKNAVGDGEIITGKRVGARTIKVKARSRNVSLNEINRRQAIEFFNPKYSFKNYVTYMGRQYYINAELDGKPKLPANNIYRPLDMTIVFFSKDPYWLSVDDYGKNIAAITSLFGFPYIEAEDVPIVADAFNFAKEVAIFNDGDVETFCKIVITAKGEVVNPKIIQGDHYIQMDDILQPEDIVVIDCDRLTVYKNDANAITKINKGSSFTEMALQVGSNTISFAADTGDTNMEVVVYYNKKYLGI